MLKKILLIEDDSRIIDIYTTVLKKAGFEVETANCSKDAMEKLEKVAQGVADKPDLVLLDLVLPDINGIEIFKKARSQKGIDDIPFFILTNYTNPDLKIISIKLKVEKYILKTDLIPSQLVKEIKDWFKE
jgi:two-component system alkaline phosphatase synthesis response regulator PhoP